ncbi:MAG: transposase [Anaerolineae bacterium]|nr:transposase [Anaerolineae bacterium]
MLRWDKQRGRLERRELWVVEAGELGAYLEREWNWRGLRQAGLIRRTRVDMATGQTKVETTTWVTSLSPQQADPETIAKLLRDHWQIENALHRVRDVTQGEDLHHARVTGLALAAIRSLALNLLRSLGFPLVPDAIRHLRLHPEASLALLTQP